MSLSSQDLPGNLKPWSSPASLNWSDFEGAPQNQSPYLAITTSGILFSINGKPENLNLKVQCYFDPALSWKKSEEDVLLNHEQWHFNITEIFARKMRKEIKEMKFNKSNFKSLLQNLHARINSDCRKYQQEYDKETDHSKRKVKQEEWSRKLQKELEALSPYASTDLSIQISN
jgi:hypothetical protein